MARKKAVRDDLLKEIDSKSVELSAKLRQLRSAGAFSPLGISIFSKSFGIHSPFLLTSFSDPSAADRLEKRFALDKSGVESVTSPRGPRPVHPDAPSPPANVPSLQPSVTSPRLGVQPKLEDTPASAPASPAPAVPSLSSSFALLTLFCFIFPLFLSETH